MEKQLLRDCAQKLLTLITDSARFFESRHSQVSRQIAAAGLMRCCTSLRGIILLEDSGLGAVSGVLGRHLWESWVVSLYALLGGDEALQVLKADDVYWKRRLVKRLEILAGYQEEWKGVPARMSIKSVTEKLRPLLAKSERTDVLDQKALGYEAVYGFQSLFSAHANLSTIGTYLCRFTNDWNVAPVPSTFSMPSRETTEGIPVILVAHLARHVFRAFGLPVETIESIGRILFANQGAAGQSS